MDFKLIPFHLWPDRPPGRKGEHFLWLVMAAPQRGGSRRMLRGHTQTHVRPFPVQAPAQLFTVWIIACFISAHICFCRRRSCWEDELNGPRKVLQRPLRVNGLWHTDSVTLIQLCLLWPSEISRENKQSESRRTNKAFNGIMWSSVFVW